MKNDHLRSYNESSGNKPYGKYVEITHRFDDYKRFILLSLHARTTTIYSVYVNHTGNAVSQRVNK